MPRYIDVEPFDVIAYETKGKEEWTDFDEGVSFMLDKIDNAPTADVAPVVHARWDEDYRCTNCRKEALCEEKPDPFSNGLNALFFVDSDHCPNCGAKMDGERRNDG